MIDKYQIGTLATFGLLATGVQGVAQAQEQKPNVLFIMVDDFGWADVGYNGSGFYETPNIDRLAAEGMQFTNGYAAAPISSPTRVSLMTGKYPARTGITDWIPGYQYNLDRKGMSKYKMCVPKIPLNMALEEVTIAEAFKEGGYKTYHVGKWHCAEDSTHYPQYQGFDVNIGGWLSGSPKGNSRNRGGEGAYFTPYNNPYLSDGPEGEYLSDRLGDEAVRLINQADGDPFFMYLSFYAVHTPVEPKLELVEYFQKKAERMGIDKIDPYTTDVQWYKDADYKSWHWKERTIQSSAEYAALVYAMDQNVGKVLDYLKAQGLEENTVVCLLGDNGGLATAETSPTCNAPLRAGKGWLYEGGIREPFLIKYPKMVAPLEVCNTPVVSVDFYPTLLDVAGLPLRPEQHMDGVSLLPLLKDDEAAIDREAIFFHYPHYGGKGDTPASAIRKGDMKLIYFYETGECELYNIKDDISETKNLADQEPEVASEMLKEIKSWIKSCGAQVPYPNKYYLKPNKQK